MRPLVTPESPQAPPTLAEILGDPHFSDRAKRLAEYLDGCCRGDGKWAAWPKVSTIAAALGWDGTDHGGRKRVERGLRELIGAGVLGRMNLRELVEWHDAEGGPLGLSWPDRLPRGMRLSLKVCVLLWRIPAAAGRLPILPRCDTGVLSNPAPERPSVASTGTLMSHGVATEVSHPSFKVRTLNGETTTDSSRTREVPGDVGSSSSSRSVGGEGPSTATLPPMAPADGPKALAPTLDRAMDRAMASPPSAELVDGPPAVADDPARAALIAKVEEIAPGPANREVRRAIHDAIVDLLKTARLAGSLSPFDHVRMAIEKAAANPKRRDTIESLARGIMRNWATEGFPAIVAPEPPARPKPRPDPESDRRAAVERRRAAVESEAEDRANRARWEALPEASKEAFRAEFDRTVPRPPAGPLARLWEVQVRDGWVWRMRQSEPV